ncbi:MAG: HDOD domain-containing protein [Solidesulfovibrio sp. DCME]|uniref:HDOD domain-containing protein n=1 Tax=Solidesulfovibrio sp. DCME TaxID=3447380 RepID=UPI003D0BF02E
MTRRILFVDDEPQLLAGLRRMLWDKRDIWDMRFAADTATALAMLEAEAADVVVADARMPGLDGPQFLETVRQRWPGTARIILTGHSERDFVFRSVRPCHQFLAKPLAPGELVAAIERVLRLSVLFTDEALRETIASIDVLPALPAVFAELTEELRSQNASVRGIAGILTRDVGLSAGLLKLVNSAFFGLPRRVSGMEQAVTLLGLETLRALVLAHGIYSLFEADRYPGFGLDGLFAHSLRTARFARLLAGLEGLGRDGKDACFMAGLLHDLGKLVLAKALEGPYNRALSLARARNITMFAAETEVLGASHAGVGAYLLGLWGFDEAVVAGVAGHHAPGLGLGAATPVAALTHVANALEHELVVVHPGYAPHVPDEEALDRLGLAGRLGAWREACRNLLQGGGGE